MEIINILTGSQFVFVLLSGIVLAFAFELLLGSLSLATAISVVGPIQRKSEKKSPTEASHIPKDHKVKSPLKKIENLAGAWALVTMSLALGGACFLALNLVTLQDMRVAIGLSLVIWATFFSVVLWLASRKMGSLTTRVLGSALEGMRSFLGTTFSFIGLWQPRERQTAQRTEAALKAIKRELFGSLSPDLIKEALQNYISSSKRHKETMPKIKKELRKTLSDPNFRAQLGAQELDARARDLIIDKIVSQAQLSPEESENLTRELHNTWTSTLANIEDPLSEIFRYLSTMKVGNVPLSTHYNTIGGLVTDLVSGQSHVLRRVLLRTTGAVLFATLQDVVLKRREVPTAIATAVLNRLEPLRQLLKARYKHHEAQTPTKEGMGVVRRDLEVWLLRTPRWYLQAGNPRLSDDLRSIMFDKGASVAEVRSELEGIDRPFFEDVLMHREDLNTAAIEALADRCEGLRQDILKKLPTETESAPRKGVERWALRQTDTPKTFTERLDDFLRMAEKQDLLREEDLERDLSILAQNSHENAESLRGILHHVDPEGIKIVLASRGDMSAAEMDKAAQLLRERLRHVSKSPSNPLAWTEDKLQHIAFSLLDRVRDFLNSTHRPELSYESMMNDLHRLFEDPKTGPEVFRARLKQFDRSTLRALIAKIRNISEKDAEALLQTLENTRDKALRKAGQLENQTRKRLGEMREQSLAQLEEGRKAAAVAAWWVFATALVSGLFSAAGGAATVFL